ncbi:MAG: hypothetical protein K8T10_02670 [Candidatus Eremiobacteraeota bacterium]|nr:hypothetical protein [Candidatus Eremiobacteraeota bacterium]
MKRIFIITIITMVLIFTITMAIFPSENPVNKSSYSCRGILTAQDVEESPTPAESPVPDKPGSSTPVDEKTPEASPTPEQIDRDPESKEDPGKKPEELPSPTPTPLGVPTPAPKTKPVVLKVNPIPIYLGEGAIYKITWQGELVGYSKFFVSNKMKLAGETFYKLESVSKLKIGMGQIDNLTFSSAITFHKKNLLPTFFHCTQKQSGFEYKVDCLISNNLVAQQNKSGKGNYSNFHSFTDGDIPMIFLDNLWGRYDTLIEHYWLLLKSRRTGNIHAYDPILQYGGNIQIRKAGKKAESIEINGKKFKAYKFQLVNFQGKVLFNIWTDEKRNILKMKEPGGGLAFTISNKNVISAFKEAKGVDMWKERVSHSNIFFPNPRDIKKLEIEMEAQGRDISADYTEHGGITQKFEGESGDGKIQGVFTVRTLKANVKNPLAYPIKEGTLPEEVLKYTKHEMGIESDDDTIHRQALEVAWKSKNVWVAAKNINKWVTNNVSLGISLPSAKMTLAGEQGNSESRALLAIALCRALGIPARKAGGIVFSTGNFIPHYWFEVYMGAESGWIPLDPSTGEADQLSATHIKLFQDGDLRSLKTKVLDFAPKPPERLTFINREITWPVGEERTYEIKREEKKIGEETALVEEVTVLGEQETYKMKFRSDLEIEGRKVGAEAMYWTTPQGLPVKYDKKLQSGDRSVEQNFLLKGKMMLEEVKGYRGDLTREIPFSHGAYLADPHFLSQWALIAGQFFDLKIGKSYRFYVFIPETLTVEKVIATVKKFESVEAGEKIYDAFRIETNKGIIFWIEKGNNRVVKVKFAVQQVDLELVKTRLKI